MNSLTRMLAVAGIGLVAGVTFGAGPAMAVTTSSQGATVAAASTASSDRVWRQYESRGECYRAGERGQDRGWWDDYDCIATRGDYVLVVDHDNDNDDWFDNDGWDRWYPGIRFDRFDRFDHHRGGGHHGGGHHGHHGRR